MWIQGRWWEMDELDRAVERSVLDAVIEGDTRISEVFVYYRNAIGAADDSAIIARCELLVRCMLQRGLITVFTSTADKHRVTHTDLEGAALDAALTDPGNWDPKRGIGADTLWMLATKKGEMHPHSRDG